MNRIKELRLLNNMKQSDLAKLLNCAPTAVSKYELGQLDISSATLLRLCDLFGCTADYLLGRSPIKSFDISQEEYRIIEIYRSMNPDGRAYALQSLDMASRLYPEKNHGVSDMEAAQ